MSILESEAEQARAQHSNLVKQYRAIGSRAIAAAVAAMKKRKPKTAMASALKVRSCNPQGRNTHVM